MSQIFHHSTNTFARITIFGAVFILGFVTWAFTELDRSAYATRATAAARAARAVQPRAPCRRARPRLPVLPYHGGDLELRQHSADQDLHELPLADLEHQPHAGAGARQFPHRRIDPLDARLRSAGFRLFQSQHSCQQGSGLRELPRKSGPDAAHVRRRTRCRWSGAWTATATPKSIVQAARVHHHHGLSAGRRPGRDRPPADGGIQDSETRAPDQLFYLPSMSEHKKEIRPRRGSRAAGRRPRARLLAQPGRPGRHAGVPGPAGARIPAPGHRLERRRRPASKAAAIF